MDQKKIRIKDFAAERGVSYNTITQYIYRVKHSTTQKSVKYEGLVQDGDGSKEKYIIVGSPLWTALDENYPKPTKPAEVVIDEGLRQELSKAQKNESEARKDAAAAWRKVAELQEAVIKMQNQIAEVKAIRLIADQAAADRDRAIEDRDRAEERAQKAVEARESAEKVANAEKGRADAAESKIAEMRNAGLWKRIRNKW